MIFHSVSTVHGQWALGIFHVNILPKLNIYHEKWLTIVHVNRQLQGGILAKIACCPCQNTFRRLLMLGINERINRYGVSMKELTRRPITFTYSRKTFDVLLMNYTVLSAVSKPLYIDVFLINRNR